MKRLQILEQRADFGGLFEPLVSLSAQPRRGILRELRRDFVRDIGSLLQRYHRGPEGLLLRFRMRRKQRARRIPMPNQTSVFKYRIVTQLGHRPATVRARRLYESFIVRSVCRTDS